MVAAATLPVLCKVGRAEWEKQAISGLHSGVIFAEIVFAALLLTLPWWGRRSATAPESAALRPDLPLRAFVPVLFVVVLAGAALRLPLAQRSMWWDELWTVRNTIVGEFRPDPKADAAAALRFRPADFKRAAWYYSKPANHPPVSLAAKACHEIWRRCTAAPAGAFNELVLRLPCLLAGLAAVAMVAILLRSWNQSIAGLGAALLLAVHPWAIRYSVDARAYALLLLLVPLGCWLLGKLLRQPDRLRWWWLFGMNQFLLMWSHVLSLYVCAALTSAGALLLWRTTRERREQWVRLLRLGAVNAWGAALLAILLLPCLVQVAHWADRNQDRNILTWQYFLETAGQATLGVERSLPQVPESSGIPTLENLHGVGPWLGWGAVTLFLLLAVRGWILLRRSVPSASLIFSALFLAAGLGLALVAATQFYFYHRFLIGLAGPLVILAACGASLSPSRRWIGPATLGIGYLLLAAPQWHLLTSRSYAPWKEASAWIQAGADHSFQVTGIGHGGDAFQAYLPAAAVLKKDDPAALENTAKAAAAAGRRFFVCYAYPALHRANLPQVMQCIEASGHFETVWEQGGIEPEFYVRICQWRP